MIDNLNDSMFIVPLAVYNYSPNEKVAVSRYNELAINLKASKLIGL